MGWKNQVTKDYEQISGYNYLGLRSLCSDENYQVGDYARNSLDWDAENDCSSDEELDGVSTVAIDISWLDGAEDLIDRIAGLLPDMESYNGGERVVLLGGWNASRGTDGGELVIANAKVLAIVKS
jgi:hypothetical protein